MQSRKATVCHGCYPKQPLMPNVLLRHSVQTSLITVHGILLLASTQWPVNYQLLGVSTAVLVPGKTLGTIFTTVLHQDILSSPAAV